MFLRWFPDTFGSVVGAEFVYFVARTTLWRWPCMNSPRNDSLVPFVYRLAVSIKLPPASRKASYTFRASSLAAPQPQSSPKVIVPSASSDRGPSRLLLAEDADARGRSSAGFYRDRPDR